jgi:hypothetical protein
MTTIQKDIPYVAVAREVIEWDLIEAGDSIVVEDNRAAMRVLVRLRHYQKMGRYNHLIMRRKKTGEGKQIRIWFLAAE